MGVARTAATGKYPDWLVEFADEEMAARAREAGASEEEAQAIVEQPSTAPPPVVQPTYQRDTKVSTRQNWKAEVTDFKALVQAAADDDQLLHLLEPNQTALNQMARAMKELMRVPGVRAYNDPNVSVKV